MGGAEYIFTGEHDADVMHNSSMINLLMARQSLVTGVKKFFTLPRLAYIQNTIRQILVILFAPNHQLIQRSQTVNMVGRNFLVKECILHIKEIMD